MADPITYQRIVLRISSPWNYGPDAQHIWTCKFNLSGDPAMASNEVEPTALDLFDPIKQLSRTGSFLEGWSYYPNESRAARDVMTYTSGQHPTTASAFAPGSGYEQQLEVCFLARAQLGKSITGKPVYLRKWIHGAVSSPDPNTKGVYVSGSTDLTVFAKWNTGSGPRSVYPVDPTGGSKPANWQCEQHLFTHQLRRGPKRKKVAVSLDGVAVVP